MSDAAEQRSRDLFNSGLNCAESTLLAMAETLGIAADILPRIATAFGAGMARTGGACGAVTGVIMGLGLARGRSIGGQPVDDVYAITQAFLAEFEARFGSTNCEALCGCHLGTPEGQAHFRATNQIANCADYVGEATRIALRLLAEDRR